MALSRDSSDVVVKPSFCCRIVSFEAVWAKSVLSLIEFGVVQPRQTRVALVSLDRLVSSSGDGLA